VSAAPGSTCPRAGIRQNPASTAPRRRARPRRPRSAERSRTRCGRRGSPPWTCFPCPTRSSAAGAEPEPARTATGGVRHLPHRRRPSRAGSRHPPLPRRAARPDGGTQRAHRAAHPFPEDTTRRGSRLSPGGVWRRTGTTRAVGAARGAGSLTCSRLTRRAVGTAIWDGAVRRRDGGPWR